MNIFDKICGVLAFLLGAIFLLLGVIGLFAGCKAHFTLPPVVGVLPAFVGWGIVRCVYIAWTKSRPSASPPANFPGNDPRIGGGA